jgi:hypothetical protein
MAAASRLLEERVQISEGVVMSAHSVSTRPLSRPEVLAAIGALCVRDALGTRLTATVVRALVVVRAIETDVERRATGAAVLVEANPFAGDDSDHCVARKAVHERIVRHAVAAVKRAEYGVVIGWSHGGGEGARTL